MPQCRRLVYLTADAEADLVDLNAEDAYVIGGIVDRNRHKLICQKRAEELVRVQLPVTARLRSSTLCDKLLCRAYGLRDCPYSNT